MTKMEEAFAVLSAELDAAVFPAYPDDYVRLPCVVFYRHSEMPLIFADDEVFLSESRYMVEVYAKTGRESESLLSRADFILKTLGFSKTEKRDARADGAQRRRSEGSSRYDLAQSMVRKKTALFTFVEGID